jgi:hypothetical protein
VAPIPQKDLITKLAGYLAVREAVGETGRLLTPKQLPRSVGAWEDRLRCALQATDLTLVPPPGRGSGQQVRQAERDQVELSRRWEVVRAAMDQPHPTPALKAALEPYIATVLSA